MSKVRVRRIHCTVTAQTFYHLKDMAEANGYSDIGRVVDQLVREHQLATKIRVEPMKKER